MSKNAGRLEDSSAGLRWRTVLLCSLAQNCAMGFAFGSFGPLLLSTEQHFGVSRTVATTGMSVMMLAIGGLSPFLGTLLERISARSGMVIGALLSALGYWGLAFTGSFNLALAMFGLIGIGVCLTAILGPLLLVSRWFPSNRGKILSLINLPIMLFVIPYIIAVLLPLYGRSTVLAALGTTWAVLALLLFWIAERPPLSAQQRADVQARAPTPAVGLAAIFKRPAFWLLSLGIGIMAGSGTAFVVHIVPFGMTKQMSLQAASGLLSVYAGAGIGGTLLFGWICDRIGPPAALVLSTICQALLWWTFLHVDGAPLYVLAALLGICIVPLVTLHGAAISQMFDPASVSRAMGYSYSIKLPFIFSFAPTMGLMFDHFGGYHMPFLLTAGLLGMAAAFFFVMLLILRRHKTILPVPV